MRGCSFGDQRIVVALSACRDWVINFDDAFLRDQDATGPEALMLD